MNSINTGLMRTQLVFLIIVIKIFFMELPWYREFDWETLYLKKGDFQHLQKKIYMKVICLLIIDPLLHTLRFIIGVKNFHYQCINYYVSIEELLVIFEKKQLHSHKFYWVENFSLIFISSFCIFGPIGKNFFIKKQ